MDTNITITQQIAAITGLKNYDDATVSAGSPRMTLPEKIQALEKTILRLDQELRGARADNAELAAKAKTAEERAIEIAAKQGAGSAADADTDKSAGKGGATTTKAADPIDAVAALYRARYGID